MGFYVHGIEFSGSIKGVIFLAWLNAYIISKRTLCIKHVIVERVDVG
jgi:hypothetical protein